MKSIEEFERLYETELRPKLEPLEADRKKFITKCRRILLIAFLLCGAAFGISYFFSEKIAELTVINLPLVLFLFCGLVCLICLITFIISFYRFKKRFTQKFKEEIVKDMVKFIDQGLNYHPESGISRTTFMNSAIFLKNPDRYKSEDYVSGTIDQTAIEFSEIHAEYKTESTNSKGQKTTTWHTIFGGLFFIADFNKHFASRTVVLPDNFGKTFAFIGQKLQSMNVMRDSLIKLEDPEFEKYFVVYGADQVEARYILSTSLMARIVDFRKKTNSKISLSFLDSKLFLALPVSENLFEPNIFSSILKFSLLSSYFNYLILVIGIVGDMNLNNRIWTKD